MRMSINLSVCKEKCRSRSSERLKMRRRRLGCSNLASTDDSKIEIRKAAFSGEPNCSIAQHPKLSIGFLDSRHF